MILNLGSFISSKYQASIKPIISMSTYTIPENQTALKVIKEQSSSRLSLATQIIPTKPNSPGPSQVLVAVKAVGINPVDNYFIDFQWSTPGTGSGIALSGEVIAVGAEVTRFKTGDSIASFIFGADEENKTAGAYQEYATVEESNSYNFGKLTHSDEMLIKGGEAIKTYEQAAAVVSSFITVGLAVHLRLVKPLSPDLVKGKKFVVYGGSTSVGIIAIQYASYLGWDITAIAGAHNHEYLKSLGASKTIDYKSENYTELLHDELKDVDFVLVCTGGEHALLQIYDALPTSRKVRLESIEFPSLNTTTFKPEVDFSFICSFTSHGETVKYGNGWTFNPLPGSKEATIEFARLVEELESKGIFPHKDTRVLQGWNGIHEGLDQLKNGGGLSWERLVARIA